MSVDQLRVVFVGAQPVIEPELNYCASGFHADYNCAHRSFQNRR